MALSQVNCIPCIIISALLCTSPYGNFDAGYVFGHCREDVSPFPYGIRAFVYGLSRPL